MTAQIDALMIRQMVEDHWRSMLVSIHQTRKPGEAPLIFQKRIEAIAATMPPDQANSFLGAVDRERERLADEYDEDPIALKRRLNLPLNNTQTQVVYEGESLGRLVARTAVRATVWESIASLFQLFR